MTTILDFQSEWFFVLFDLQVTLIFLPLLQEKKLKTDVQDGCHGNPLGYLIIFGWSIWQTSGLQCKRKKYYQNINWCIWIYKKSLIQVWVTQEKFDIRLGYSAKKVLPICWSKCIYKKSLIHFRVTVQTYNKCKNIKEKHQANIFLAADTNLWVSFMIYRTQPDASQITSFLSDTFHGSWLGQLSRLTLSTLWANSAQDQLLLFFLFSRKIVFVISCKLPLKETICMKC